jgi:CheY-like chemotaxis protein
MIGKSTEMLHIDTEHFRNFGRMSESALERDGFFESDFRMKRKNGEVFDSEHYEIPGFDLEGWRKGVISVVRDISVLKSQHAALQESEAANRVIIDSLPAHIAVLDRTAKILRVNQAWQNFAAANGAEGHPSVCALCVHPGCPPAWPQLHQVIMNLCTNAFHAMRATGGVLDIKQNPVFLDDNNARRYNLDRGFYLKLSVRDTGKGISPEIMKRIFEPYFTTRPREQGTGLGLAVAQGIVTSHGGTIVAYSQQGKGSRFDVYLPLSDLPVEATSDNIADFPTGRERILFVDDEQALVNIARRMLESLGYQVMAMNDAHSALAAFREDPSAFDLVMTDLTMPGMTGIELASQVHDLRPATPIVLLTGYSEEAAQDVEHNAGIHMVLIKPFSFRQLADSARKVLDSRAGLGTGGN